MYCVVTECHHHGERKHFSKYLLNKRVNSVNGRYLCGKFLKMSRPSTGEGMRVISGRGNNITRKDRVYEQSRNHHSAPQ